VLEVADIVQIGARNMQNYSLLKHAGRAGQARAAQAGLSATIQELLLSAEYILAEATGR
jgi:3-deoxy-7-phosphoheptulonate synthase